MKRFVSATIVAIVLFLPEQANANFITNGDFETGDFTGWTTFTTANGTLGTGFPDVVPFDTNNDGTATKSARFSVGEVNFLGVGAGGGIFQNITIGAGPLNLRADIAVQDVLGGGQLQAGIFDLLLDGIVVDTHDFGLTTSFAMFSLLANVSNVTAGTHEVRIQITRPFTQDPDTRQFIDNVSATVIPEPSTYILFTVGILVIVGMGYRQRKKAA